MASPAVTYTFSNSTTADATQVNQNFTDIINGVTDGTKDLSISALTVAGNATFTGTTITFGNATTDSVVFTGLVGSHMSPSAHNTYDLGTVTTLGYRAMYFASSSATKTAKLQGPAISSDITVTLPAITGTLALYAAPTVQTFTSGTNATYTTPANCKYIRVRMVGGGAGGGGSSTAAAGDGGTGTTGNASTWKSADDVTTYATAGGGVAGAYAAAGGDGGTASIGNGAIGTALAGGGGCGSFILNTNAGNDSRIMGGQGGASFFGGNGKGGVGGAAGNSAAVNTGGGGGGAGGVSTQASAGGSGGGSGGYCEFILTNPAATYHYTVGGTAAGGTAGTSGSAGGTGAAGYIEVMEFYG